MKDYDLFVATRDITIRSGAVGELETNRVSAYLGEWVTFSYPIDPDGAFEIRFPIEYLMDNDLAERVKIKNGEPVGD